MRRAVLTLLGTALLVLPLLPAAAGSAQTDGSPTPIARGPHVSGVARYQPHASATSNATTATCPRPGYGTNYVTDCEATTGRPVNETAIAQASLASGPLEVAGANDYNSYNGQGQDGFYTSRDGKAWSDSGPIDAFPHNTNNAAGDPGVAVAPDGTVYYSSLFFNFHNCGVGGVELLVGAPNTSGAGGAAGYSWTTYQIASNSRSSFQDKPAIAYDGGASRVYESWTQFGSCSGSNVASPIHVAVFDAGTTAAAPTTTLQVAGSTYSQGSSIAPDGSGGFWIAWEEFPSASATIGAIYLDHYSYSTSSGWTPTSPTQISPTDFADLPSPLPGYSFRDNSFPALTVVSGTPYVTWTADTLTTVTSHSGSTRMVVQGPGRAYLSAGGGVGTAITPAPSAGDQFFPAITPDSASVDVSYCQTDPSNSSYDAYLTTGVTTSTPTVIKVSTASSFPNNDAFFSGQFIGDYTALTNSTTLGRQPIWTDIRGADPNYPGYEMDAVVNTP